MKSFGYVAPGSVESSVHALRGASADSARLLAGGTDLLPLMKANVGSVLGLTTVRSKSYSSAIRSQ